MAEFVERQRRVTMRQIATRIFRHENAALGIVLGVIIGGMAIATKGATASAENMMIVLLASATIGIASIGQAFVILTGGIDLSVGGMAAMISMLGATMMTSMLYANIVGYQVSPTIVMPLMVLMGAGIGALNGLAVSRIGLPPLIATLAMWRIANGVAFQIGLGHTVFGLPDSFAYWGQGWVSGVPVAAVIFVVVCVVGYFILNRTVFGKSVYAVGGNPLSAWLSGIRISNIRLLVYILSGILAAIGSIIATSRVMAASARTMAGLELDTIACVSVGGVSLAGGKGNIVGVILGVLIIGVIDNGLSVLGANPALLGISKGLIIITAVAVDYLRRRG
jgi:ribose/xylose/arabinose/galactoside ABC-type transport system permease subunit